MEFAKIIWFYDENYVRYCCKHIHTQYTHTHTNTVYTSSDLSAYDNCFFPFTVSFFHSVHTINIFNNDNYAYWRGENPANNVSVRVEGNGGWIKAVLHTDNTKSGREEE